MFNLLKAIKEMSEQIYENSLEETLDSDTLEVMELVESYFDDNDYKNIAVCLEDKQTYDLAGWLVFMDEYELERLNDTRDIQQSVPNEDQWMQLGDPE